MIENAEFCNSCEYRGRTVNGRRCIRTDMDVLSRVAFIDPDTMFHTDDEKTGVVKEVSPAEAAMSFAIDASADMLACAEIVSAGGEPLW